MYMHGSISYLLCLVATDTIFISMYICFASVGQRRCDMFCLYKSLMNRCNKSDNLYSLFEKDLFSFVMNKRRHEIVTKKKKKKNRTWKSRFKRDNCIFRCYIIVAFAHFWAFKHIFLSISSLIPLYSFGECKKKEWKKKRKQTLTRSRENVDTVASFHSRGSS